MKKMEPTVLLAGLMILVSIPLAVAESESAGQKTLASTMDVYVFPTEGQDAKQQSMDEAACYDWAVQNTGTDPFDLQKQAEQQQAQADQQKQDVQGSSAGKGYCSTLSLPLGFAKLGKGLRSGNRTIRGNRHS